ncbi:hypothetical protein RND81_03G140100 [Saponaria officinalis]|uniref:Bifunctional inhibitor/plant lipid transfer protein/seed storage helical domain-containing protein n=1 Tax=Saponaria officinalis TaxID=3572 RepID=A0AAW1M7B8_SAPOF
MAFSINDRVLMFIMCLGLIGVYYGKIKVVNGQCGGDLQGLLTQCATFVQKPGPISDPSQGCCNVIKTIDVDCVCKHIPKQAEEMISMPKAMHCLEFCGKPLAHGTKCGSYTVPLAIMKEKELN